jgi:hypothetical protein
MRWLLLIALVGCDQGEIPDCASTAAALVKGGDAEVASRCIVDRWSTAARTCIAKAPDEEVRDACVGRHLTAEQRDGIGLTPQVMRVMRELANKMCACTDARCAQQVSEEMATWAQQMAKKHPRPPKLTEADTKVAQAIGMRMSECMTTAMQAPR